MKYCLSSFVLVPALMVALAVLPVAAQTLDAKKPVAGRPSAKSWIAPHTPDGQPDLQGIWSNPTITPFERPAEFGEKAVLTEKEAAELEARAAKARVDGPPKEGDPGSYNQAWFDSGTKVVSTRQTSLVVNPPDGKV